jgi:hypothetical protein
MTGQLPVVSRREILHLGSIGSLRLVMSLLAAGEAFAQERTPLNPSSEPKALVFDTFGTVVDWRSSVTREVDELAKRKVSKLTALSLPMPGVPAMVPA